MALIFFASGDAGSTRHTSRIIGPILRWLNPAITDEGIRQVQLVIRKGGHLTGYAVLSVLIWRAQRQAAATAGEAGEASPHPPGWNAKHAAFAWTLATLYAVSDELHQSFVPSRQAQWTDVLIDATGAALGLALARAWARRCAPG